MAGARAPQLSQGSWPANLAPSLVRTRERLEPRLIGTAEYVDFPDWGVQSLSARVDTGARTSALHVENVKLLAGSRVRFDVRLRRDDPSARVTVETKVSRRTEVRASTGQTEPRLFVKAHIRLGGREQLIEVGLVDRRHMLYRMLLGRSALQRRYVVDVSKRYVLGAAAGAKLAAKASSAAGRGPKPQPER
ncbi:MAG TPA: RimK/LysX family protein [Polyangiaceae bacterium]|nr:RimK/LysX family protein [Polyangiaceae bacterium]